MKVKRWDETTDGKLSDAALTRKLESLGYSVNAYVYPAGTYFSPHTHSVDKIDAVLSGEFRITMDDESVVLRPGDLVYVPRGVEHSAEVVGDEEVFSLDAVKRH